jgi:putative two-component system response regulator
MPNQTLQDTQARILVVDDQELNLRLLEDILRGAGYAELVCTTDPRQVLSLYARLQPDLILLDLMMPYLNGFQVMERLRRLVPEGDYVPILVLTADVTPETRWRALSVGAQDFLTKPLDPVEVRLRVRNLLKSRLLHLQLVNQNQTLEEKVQERTQEVGEAHRQLEESHIEILNRLSIAAEYRDDQTGRHTRRVSEVSALLARALRLPARQVSLIWRAAPLHDVGKIGIPDAILLKPGRLSPDEAEIMRSHTVIGGKILSEGRSDLVRIAHQIALTHHERWDGAGYPQGLGGDAIPIEGRIVALADVFDALTHGRPYKPAWPIEQAIAEIERQKHGQFDPQVVDAFLAMEIWLALESLEAADTGKL